MIHELTLDGFGTLTPQLPEDGVAQVMVFEFTNEALKDEYRAKTAAMREAEGCIYHPGLMDEEIHLYVDAERKEADIVVWAGEDNVSDDGDWCYASHPITLTQYELEKLIGHAAQAMCDYWLKGWNDIIANAASAS